HGAVGVVADQGKIVAGLAGGEDLPVRLDGRVKEERAAAADRRRDLASGPERTVHGAAGQVTDHAEVAIGAATAARVGDPGGDDIAVRSDDHGVEFIAVRA